MDFATSGQIFVRQSSAQATLSGVPVQECCSIPIAYVSATKKLDIVRFCTIHMSCPLPEAARRGSEQFAPETAARPDSVCGSSSLELRTGLSYRRLPAAFGHRKSSLRDYNGVLPHIAVFSQSSFGLRP